MAERLSDKVREYLFPARGRTVYLKDIRAYLKIEPGSKDDQNLRVLMAVNFVKDHTVKPSGLGDGGYKVIMPVDPIKFSLDGKDEEGLVDFKFPRSYIDDTSFGIENLVEVFEGDMIGIFGETNFGKSCIAYSILAENLGLFPIKPLLMGNELTTSHNQVTPKIKRRLRRMNWAEWENDEGMRFDIKPVGADYEEYIRPNTTNVVDWITLPGEFWMIDSVLKGMKDVVDKGVLVPVLQKKKNVDDPEGGERAKRHCDVELRIDSFGQNESILTIGKVKSSKGRATGRMWAFEITDYGANLQNIREMVKCSKCWAKGYIRAGQENKRCPVCHGMKYVEKLGG